MTTIPPTVIGPWTIRVCRKCGRHHGRMHDGCVTYSHAMFPQSTEYAGADEIEVVPAAQLQAAQAELAAIARLTDYAPEDVAPGDRITLVDAIATLLDLLRHEPALVRESLAGQLQAGEERAQRLEAERDLWRASATGLHHIAIAPYEPPTCNTVEWIWRCSCGIESMGQKSHAAAERLSEKHVRCTEHRALREHLQEAREMFERVFALGIGIECSTVVSTFITDVENWLEATKP